MVNSENWKSEIIGAIGIFIGGMGIAYAFSSHKKVDKLCKVVGQSVETLSEATPVVVSQYMVDQAIKNAVNNEVQKAVQTVSDKVKRDVNTMMMDEVCSSVQSAYDATKKTVANKLADHASKINIKQLQDEVRKQASDAVLAKFDANLDSLLEDFGGRLKNISKIYQTIENQMTPSDGKQKPVYMFDAMKQVFVPLQ